MKIAIVGAGFAGLAAAISLKGHDITIYERAERLEPVGAGVLLQPFGLALLQHLGIKEEVINLGDKINWLHGLNQSGKCILDLKYAKANPDYFGLGIHRGSLFNAILKKALESNPEIKLNTTVLQN